MIRTYNEFIERVQAHVVEGLGKENATLAEKLQNVVTHFNQSRWKNQTFVAFLQSNPSCIKVEHTYHAQRKALDDWYGRPEGVKLNCEDIPGMYYMLIYTAFLDLCDKNDIPFMR